LVITSIYKLVMRNIALLFLIPFYVSINLSAQDAPKNTNTIILVTSYLSPDEAIINIGHILLDNNYTPENINKELSFIVTAPFQYKSVNLKVTFRAQIKEGVVYITCSGIYGDGGSYYYDPVLNQSQIWNSIINSQKKLGSDKIAWAGFLKIVELIPHSEKSYDSREYSKPALPW